MHGPKPWVQTILTGLVGLAGRTLPAGSPELAADLASGLEEGRVEWCRALKRARSALQRAGGERKDGQQGELQPFTARPAWPWAHQLQVGTVEGWLFLDEGDLRMWSQSRGQNRGGTLPQCLVLRGWGFLPSTP